MSHDLTAGQHRFLLVAGRDRVDVPLPALNLMRRSEDAAQASARVGRLTLTPTLTRSLMLTGPGGKGPAPRWGSWAWLVKTALWWVSGLRVIVGSCPVRARGAVLLKTSSGPPYRRSVPFYPRQSCSSACCPLCA